MPASKIGDFHGPRRGGLQRGREVEVHLDDVVGSTLVMVRDVKRRHLCLGR